MTAPKTSPFLTLPPYTSTDQLAILHLRRDSLVPTVLQESDNTGIGYAEGRVATTRFGSYPHSTLLKLPWGSQVLASQVDTGSRGRPGLGAGRKRKRVDENQDNSTPKDDSEDGIAREEKAQPKKAVRASSGFCHIVPPTPEAWTLSLPHRTQVVYTPDYSYIIQKLRIRPGSTVIEAGAGSGSFTHAAVRAAFNGYPGPDDTPDMPRGHVFSFEYHEPRAETLRQELEVHGLDEMVTLTHRDVYSGGFAVPGRAVRAQHIFLDLPAPWTALPHLSRMAAPNALDPTRPAHLCAFLPCIEQAQRMAAALRQAGWVEPRMHELAHRRLEVRRERVGLRYEGLRGVNAVAGSVDEALARLRTVEARARGRRAGQLGGVITADDAGLIGDDALGETKAERLERLARQARDLKPWRDGRLVCRTEPEIKTHTSYLVFAVLPRAWTAEDEERVTRKWAEAGGDADVDGGGGSGKKGKKGKR